MDYLEKTIIDHNQLKELQDSTSPENNIPVRLITEQILDKIEGDLKQRTSSSNPLSRIRKIKSKMSKEEKRILSLKEMFEFYCKQTYIQGKHATFERIQQENSVMTLGKFMHFCRDYKIIEINPEEDQKIQGILGQQIEDWLEKKIFIAKFKEKQTKNFLIEKEDVNSNLQTIIKSQNDEIKDVVDESRSKINILKKNQRLNNISKAQLTEIFRKTSTNNKYFSFSDFNISLQKIADFIFYQQLVLSKLIDSLKSLNSLPDFEQQQKNFKIYQKKLRSLDEVVQNKLHQQSLELFYEFIQIDDNKAFYSKMKQVRKPFEMRDDQSRISIDEVKYQFKLPRRFTSNDNFIQIKSSKKRRDLNRSEQNQEKEEMITSKIKSQSLHKISKTEQKYQNHTISYDNQEIPHKIKDKSQIQKSQNMIVDWQSLNQVQTGKEMKKELLNMINIENDQEDKFYLAEYLTKYQQMSFLRNNYSNAKSYINKNYPSTDEKTKTPLNTLSENNRTLKISIQTPQRLHKSNDQLAMQRINRQFSNNETYQTNQIDRRNYGLISKQQESQTPQKNPSEDLVQRLQNKEIETIQRENSRLRNLILQQQSRANKVIDKLY